MQDLKNIITSIQANKELDKRYEIVKVAYERGELVKLLSADDEYAYDANGNLWLHSGGPDADLDADPISIRGIVSGIEKYYFNTDSEEFKQKVVDAFFALLKGTPQQVYFAVQMFYALATDDADESSSFYDWIEEIKFTDSLRPALTNTMRSRRDELLCAKVFNSSRYSDGVYGKCVYYSNLLIEDGIVGFIEG